LLFLDPGSEIRDPGWLKIRIRDKHPGSATLIFCVCADDGSSPLKSFSLSVPYTVMNFLLASLEIT
jgi:hypothetical protein